MISLQIFSPYTRTPHLLENDEVHDWLLIEIKAEWENGSLKLTLKDPSSRIFSIFAKNFRRFEISRKMEWGRSESINSHKFISCESSAGYVLAIEMQSGDSIKIEAEEFTLPDGVTV